MHRETPRSLRYIGGYLELGMLPDAAAEFARIDPEDLSATDVRVIRLDLALAAKEWDIAVATGTLLAHTAPDKVQGWIGWAYALRELQRVSEARDVLLTAEEPHGKTSALLHYNLACYYCLLGDLETARTRLDRACRMEQSFAADARHDPDLKDLRAQRD